MRTGAFLVSVLPGLLIACRAEPPRKKPAPVDAAPERPGQVVESRPFAVPSFESTVAVQPLQGTPTAASLPADTAPSLPEHALIVGVVRWDGIVAPVGAFDGTRWRQQLRRWFESRSSPLTWHFTSVAGTKRQLRGGRIVHEFRCNEGHEEWGQETDLGPDTLHWTEEERWWADHSCPAERVGLALSDTLTVLPFEAAEADERPPILELIRPTFEEMETRTIVSLGRDSTDASRAWTGHPIDLVERSRSPLELAVLERVDAPDAGVRLYRFEAVRRYRPTTRYDQTCPTRTTLDGFVVKAEGRLRLVEPQVSIKGQCVDAPGMEAAVVEPFGLLHLGGRAFLLGLQDGWETSAPVVSELTPTGLREVLSDWER